MAFERPTHYKGWIFGFCALVFFLGSFIFASHSDLFISPDETANAFFARAFAQTGTLRVFDAMQSDIALHPRSVAVIDKHLVPTGFLGLPFIYGLLARAFGNNLFKFATPLFAILGTLAWWRILLRWFSARTAFTAALITLMNPVVWYYSARGLMPNVLFVSLLIIAIYVLLTRPHERIVSTRLVWFSQLDLCLAGFLFGLALFVRLSEAVWVVPLMICLLVLERMKIRMCGVFVCLFGFTLSILLYLALNNATYGSPWLTGYTLSNANTQTTIAQNVAQVFSYGFHPRAIIQHVWLYAISLFWWLSALVCVGIPIMFARVTRDERIQRAWYLACFVLLAIWLFVLYGSMRLFDNPDQTQVTIANSYTRYWLPLFIFSTPFVATAIVWISERTKTRAMQFVLFTICLALVFSFNIRAVFFDGQDALLHVAETLDRSEQIRARVFDVTESDAVMVTDRADKLFFPARHVLVPLRSDATYAAIPKLVAQRPVYYYGITFPKKDIDFLNDIQFKSSGVRIEYLETFDEESLYRILP